MPVLASALSMVCTICGKLNFFYSLELFKKAFPTKMIFTIQSNLIITFEFIKLSIFTMTNFMCIAGNKRKSEKYQLYAIFFMCVYCEWPNELKKLQNDL